MIKYILQNIIIIMDFISIHRILFLITFAFYGSLSGTASNVGICNSWTFKKKFFLLHLSFSEPQLVITSTVQDLELLIFENRTVKFQVENASLLDNPIQIVFIENPNDVVKLTPTSVQIHKDDEDFYIQFYATDAGKTTVTVNKSTDILK